MSNKTDRQIRRTAGILFLLFWALIFAFGITGGIFRLRSPIEDHWQLWCRNWPDLALFFLFGSGFLVVGFTFILFPQKTFRILMQREADDISQSWGLIIGGLFIILPGISILSGLFMDWVTYCYP